MREVLIYLHGFLSSTLSEKAQLLKKLSEQRGMLFYGPDLNRAPSEAIEEVKKIIGRHREDTIYLVGSSLGGFYATTLLGEFGFRSVLINPAIAPWRGIEQFVGKQRVYGTGEMVEVKVQYGAELEAMAIRTVDSPKEVLVTLATGDEVLDWHEAEMFYANCRRWVIPGEDHRLSNILKYADRMLDFLQKDE